MKTKNKFVIICISFILITVGLSGCNEETGKDDNKPVNYASYPVMSGDDFDILDNSYEEYENLRQTMSAEDARQQLVDDLNSTEGVEKAELGADGYTIFIKCSDGVLTAVDTFELDEELPPTAGFKKKNLPVTGGLKTSSIKKEDLPVTSNLVVVGPSEKATCQNRKMLVLGPCYYDFPKQATDDTIQYFKDHGWSDDDITLKLVSKEPYEVSSDCFSISPSDYFNQEDYGIILFTGHGTIMARNNFNEDNLYLQFCYVTNESFIANPLLQEWMDDEKLIVFQKFLAGSDGSRYFVYSTAIRADLLRQKMSVNKLQSSYCYFATCYGIYFKDVYLNNGAKIFCSWDNPVDGDYADENMKNMARQMLEDSKSVYESYIDTSIIKSYTTDDPDHPERGMIPAWSRLPKVYTKISFLISPDPTLDETASNYYMPGWIDLTIDEIPDGASLVRIGIYDGSNLLTEADQDILLGSESFTIEYVGEDIFTPTGDVNVKVEAFGSSGNSLAVGEETVSLAAGENQVSVSLSTEDTDLYWVLCGDEDKITNVTFYNDALGYGNSHVGFLMYINEEYTYYAFLNYNKYPFKANSGDSLRFQYNVGHKEGGNTWNFGPIWLHLVDSDFKIKLTDGANGVYTGPYKQEMEVVYDQTFSIPNV